MRGMIAWRPVSAAGLAFAVLFGATGAADAEAPATSPTNSYIPVKMTPVNLNTGGKVCVIGYSQQKPSLKVAGNTFVIPPLYLNGTAGNPSSVAWTAPSATTTIQALELGKDVTAIPVKPQTASTPQGYYINAGTLTFFYVASSSFNCASITYTYANAATGQVNTPYFPYPKALFEISTYPVDTSTNTQSSYYDAATIDTSNVDSFEIPTTVGVYSRSGGQSTGVAAFGNQLGSPLVNGKTVISGPNGTGSPSPFVTWLSQQNSASVVAAPFASLALTTAINNYPMIQSPTDYLNAKCLQVSSGFVPNIPSCTLNGQLAHWIDPLNSYFDQELAAFFRDVSYTDTNTKQTSLLSIMGDASGSIASGAWTVRGRTYCPLYLIKDSSSLLFGFGSNSMVLCNPVGQVQTLVYDSAGQYPSVTSTVLPPKSTSNPQPAAVATIAVTAPQCAQASGLVGLNLGQPETGYVVNIASVSCGSSSNTITANVVNPPAAGAATSSTQSYCTALPCNSPNPSFKTWVLSNIPWAPGLNWAETASQMVFGNDGVFAAFQPVMYAANKDLQIVAASLARNVVMALNRGIAHCNNVTMNAAAPPPHCHGVAALASSQMVAGAGTASDAYWSNQANWYPTGARQNYYAQYLHTMQLGGKPATSIFLPPSSVGMNVASSLQDIQMGMAYGFGYDENPAYLLSKKVPTVPSKLDPIPTLWWTYHPVIDLQIFIGNLN